MAQVSKMLKESHDALRDILTPGDLHIPLACIACGLHEGCKTPDIGMDWHGDSRDYCDGVVDVLIVGEAPGSQEDEQGVPFVGKSGMLLRETVSELGLDDWSVAYINVVRCRPEANKTPTTKQMKLCGKKLLEDIERLDPVVVVLLGNTPLRSVLGNAGITKWHGVAVDRDGIVYMPTYHPAYVLRRPDALHDFADDLGKVIDILEGTKEVVDVSDKYKMVTVIDERGAWDMYNTMSYAEVVAFDSEITSLDVFNENERVLLTSFAVKYPEPVAWVVVMEDSDVVSVVMEMLEDADINKVGHNIKFDAKASYALLDTWVEGIVGDTMLLSYIIDSQPGRHGLKMLAGRYLGMYDYDKELSDYLDEHKEASPGKGGDFGLVPLDVMIPYAAKDAIATLELHYRLHEELTEEQVILYEDLLVPASVALTQMEVNGACIDQDIVSDYIEVYKDVQEVQYELMLQDKHVVSYTKTRLKKEKKYTFNPGSPMQVRDIMYGKQYYGIKSTVKTATGKPSTKWDVIKVYVDDVPFVATLRYYKLLGKMLSTYLTPAKERWPSTSDGRVRSNYLLHGTVTGRLSSRKPNLQNIPTPEKEPGTLLEKLPIKNMFTCTHKTVEDGVLGGDAYMCQAMKEVSGCLCAIDYSGMELRTMASLANCRSMIQAFEDGVDVHSFVTELLYGIKRENYSEEEWKPKRYRAKWVNWTLLFGGSEYTLHNLYGIDMDEASDLVSSYYEAFPEVLDFRDDTLAKARENGYVDSPFGRRRWLPYINDGNGAHRSRAEREAVNMPVQSAASDILMCALIIIDKELQEGDFNSLMINTVHDSIMFDVWPGELIDLVALCKDVMEDLPTVWGPKHFPRFDFSWFTVPLKVDIEIGSHYGCVKHYQ